MSQVALSSLVSDWKKAQSTNSTATSFSASLATATKPEASATRSIISVVKSMRDSNTLCVMPYGGNDNNDVINQKVRGWNFIKSAGTYGLWVPSLICEVQATLSSTLVGVAGEDVVATELFADILTLTTGIAVLKQGTADIDAATYLVDVSGFELVEITYDLGAGGDTQNALYRFV